MAPELASDPPADLERELASRLAAIDELDRADAARELDEMMAGLDQEGAQRLAGALECLDQIHKLWPRRGQASECPQEFGKFILERELGRGGHGIVFLALDPKLNRRIALKIPRAECLDDPGLKRRFFTEARAVAMFDHPGIVPLLEMGTVGPICYMASTYCSGPNLGMWLKTHNQALSPRAAARLVAEVAEAIGHAHARGVVHRDLKPSNILLEAVETGDDSDALPVRPRVADFGLAKLLESEAELTRTGLIIGTPRYMAPEQAHARHHEVGPATDVYAIGAMLQEMLTGRLYEESAAEEHATVEIPAGVARQNGVREGRSPNSSSVLRAGRRSPLVPFGLRAIVAKCMEPDPSRRYADASLLAADLRRFLAGEPVRAAGTLLFRPLIQWASRRPATITSIVALASVALTVILLERRPALTSAATHTPAAVNNDKPREADRMARLNRYVDDMRLAYEQAPFVDRVTGKPQQSLSLLNRHRPGHGEEDIRSLEWYYLWRQLHGERQTLVDHKGTVFWLCYSPDGALLASAGVDGARVWDSKTGALKLSLRQHTDDVNWVAFSPDGRLVATASDDRTVGVWRVSDGSPRSRRLAHKEKVEAVLFSTDGRNLITADRGGVVTIWDAARGSVLRTHLASTSSALEAMALSPDGSLLATAATDEVVLWELPALRRAGPSVKAPRGHGFHGVAFSHDGGWFATAGGSNESVRIWDTKTGKLLFSARHHPVEGATSVSFFPDERNLLSTGSDYAARLWDPNGGPPGAILSGHTDIVWCGALAPDGKTVATASKDGTVKLWSFPAVPMEGTIDPSMAGATAVGYSAEGRDLYTLNDAGQCKLWDSESGRPLKDLPFTFDKRPVAATFSPDSTRIAAVDQEGTISIGSPLEARPLLTLYRAAAARPCLAFSGGSRALAFVTPDGSVGEVDATRAMANIERLHSPGSAPTCLAFAASGSFLAGGCDRRLVIWDLQTRRVRGVSEITTREDITAVAICPDGSLCATNGQGAEIWLWDVATLRVKARLTDRELAIHCLAFSEDGRTLVSGGECATIWLWNVATGRQLFTLSGPRSIDPSIRVLRVGSGGVSAIFGGQPSGRTANPVWHASCARRETVK